MRSKSCDKSLCSASLRSRDTDLLVCSIFVLASCSLCRLGLKLELRHIFVLTSKNPAPQQKQQCYRPTPIVIRDPAPPLSLRRKYGAARQGLCFRIASPISLRCDGKGFIAGFCTAIFSYCVLLKINCCRSFCTVEVALTVISQKGTGKGGNLSIEILKFLSLSFVQIYAPPRHASGRINRITAGRSLK